MGFFDGLIDSVVDVGAGLVGDAVEGVADWFD